MTYAIAPLKRLFASVVGGAWGSEPEEGEVVLPCVRGTDFQYDLLRVKANGVPLRGFRASEVLRRVATPGDLIIEKSGGGENQPVGRAVLFDQSERAMPTNFAARLRPVPTVDPRFVCYLLASLYSDGRTRSAINQTTGIQNLDMDAFLNIHVLQPDLSRQRAIADYLDSETARIDVLIAKKRRMIDLLEERRDSVVRNATRTGVFGAPLRPVPIPWINEIPSHWEVRPLKRVGPLAAGVAFPDIEQGNPEGSIPYIKVSDFTLPGNEEFLRHAANEVTAETARRLGSPIFPPGTVMFPKIGVALLSNRRRITAISCCSDQNVMGLIVEHGSEKYFYYLLQSFDFGRLRMPGPVPLLNEGDASDLPVPVPPLTEQEEIVAWLDQRLPPLAKLIQSHRTSVDLLIERRQTLITAAVTGEFEVPMPEVAA